VIVDGVNSTSRTQRAGLPQGAVLSLILFTFYISDIPRFPHVQLALYADDTALVAVMNVDTIVRRPTMAVCRLKQYFARWRLQVNISKTEAIFFTKRRPLPTPALHIDGQAIPWSPSVKYLGLHLTPSLTFTTHVRRIAHVALGALAHLFPLLARDSTLSTSTKLRLYLTIIRPILTYGAPVRCSTSDTNIRTVQNKCLRVLSDYPRNTPINVLHASLGMVSFKTCILHLATKFYDQCTHHSNPLIRDIGNYYRQKLHTMYQRYSHKRIKHALLQELLRW
jgi:hypothetical protein